MAIGKFLLVITLVISAPLFADTIAVIGTGNVGAAKEQVAKMITAMGLVPFDLGPIEVAHWTEYSAVVFPTRP